MGGDGLNKWTTLESDYHFKTPFGNLRKDKCRLPDGSVINEYYVNEYSDWVNAVVLTEDHQVVLVEQYRHAGEGFFLEIPAGKVEENESSEDAVLRELKEETGYTSNRKPEKLGEYMVNPATQTNKVITYLIRGAFKDSVQNLDTTEEIRVHLYNFGEFGRLLRESKIDTQLFTASAYYMAKDFLDLHP
jgi:ADP-ribose pyrophosphatase